VWLNDRQEIAAAVSYAGNLPIEAVRPEYRDMLPRLIASATADRVKWLSALPVKPVQGSFAITDARLIDGTGAGPVENATVVVRDGRIVTAGRAPAPARMRTIDARGATLLPGLWEMHAHFAQVEYGPAYLAAGVTTTRDLGGEFEFLTAVRDAINLRGAVGPHLVMAGLVDGSGTGTFGTTWADTPAQGRAVVAKYKAAGFAQMKIYNRIRPDVLRAIAAEAHRLGMTVTGHVPEGMTAVEGVEAGMDMINHFGPITQTVRAMDLERAVAFFKQHHTVIDPTFAWGELLGRPKTVEIASFEPGFAKAPYTLTSVIGTASGRGSQLADSFAILRALHAAEVPIVAGTDKAVPAHSLHRELELYVEAGLTPMDVIQLATLGSARVMGMDGEVGSIEAGKRADMILVDGNPLQDFHALRKVTRVISNGRVFDPAELWKSVGFEP
jgi:imidazolonepropionase-like amidohydrolase